MLIEDGYRVVTAPSVEAGLKHATEEQPDALLLDFHMPIADGLECLRRLRTALQGVTVPVAILTGDYFLDEEVAGQLRDLNARIHFKPLWEDDLRRVVRELLNSQLPSAPVSVGSIDALRRG